MTEEQKNDIIRRTDEQHQKLELLKDAFIYKDADRCKELLDQGVDPMLNVSTNTLHYDYFPAIRLFVLSVYTDQELTEDTEKICNYLIDCEKANLIYDESNHYGSSFLALVLRYAEFETQKRCIDRLVTENKINHNFGDEITPLTMAIIYCGNDSEIVQYMKTLGEVRVTYRDDIPLSQGDFVRIKETGETGCIVESGRSSYSGNILKYKIRKDLLPDTEVIDKWYFRREIELVKMEIILPE